MGEPILPPLLLADDQSLLDNGFGKHLTKLKDLTPRQREILQRIGQNKSTKEIAVILAISVKTVEYHTSKMMQTLGIHTTAELRRYAVAHGLAGP